MKEADLVAERPRKSRFGLLRVTDLARSQRFAAKIGGAGCSAVDTHGD